MPKKIDLKNQQFGYLTVIEEESPRSNPKRIKWICRCQCGNMTTVTTSDLRSGHTSSCGKCGITKNKNKLTGFKSGRLTAIKPTNKRSSNGEVIWECRCECGNISYVRASALKAKVVLSCGCIGKEKLIEQNHNNTIDLTGQKFGRLTVIKKISKPEYYKKNTTFWQCKCDCGNICEVDGSNLRTGNTQSCGCLKRQNSSHGEEKIKQILQENNIVFQTEKIFKECKFDDTGYYGRFDFYLPDYNILIEFDGIQHFKEGSGIYDSKQQVLKTQKRDLIKTKFAKDYGYTLIRIPYTSYDDINLNMLLNK